jgi:hypothetical protein
MYSCILLTLSAAGANGEGAEDGDLEDHFRFLVWKLRATE